MLPRLFSAHFGLLDDGRTLMFIERAQSGVWDYTWDYAAGRFRPVYWLYYVLPAVIFGKAPVYFFLNNTLLLMGTVICLISLMRRTGASRLQASATGLFLVLAAPMVENYYTLSKGEAIQVFWLCFSLWIVTYWNQCVSLWKRGTLLLALVGSLLMALLAKETSLVILPISLAWFGYAWLRSRIQHTPSTKASVEGIYLLAAALGVALFMLLRSQVISASLTEGNYTNNYSFSLERLLGSFSWWRHLWVQDFSYLLPLLFIVFIWALKQRSLVQDKALVYALIWAGGWALVFIPWIYTVEYYMLPLATGIAVIAGIAIDAGKRIFQTGSRLFKGVAVLAFFLAGLLWGITLLNSAGNAQIQLALDASSAEMLDFVAQHAAAEGVVWVNIQQSNEYVDGIVMHLKSPLNRPDLEVAAFEPQFSPTDSRSYYLVVPSTIDLIPLHSVRYGISGMQGKWNEDLQPYLNDPAHPWELVFETRHQFNLFNIDLPRTLCPLRWSKSYCQMGYPVVTRGLFSFGWKVYRLTGPSQSSTP